MFTQRGIYWYNFHLKWMRVVDMSYVHVDLYPYDHELVWLAFLCTFDNLYPQWYNDLPWLVQSYDQLYAKWMKANYYAQKTLVGCGDDIVLQKAIPY